MDGRGQEPHGARKLVLSPSSKVAGAGQGVPMAQSEKQEAASNAPFVIGVAGGTASGKTSVCRQIIQQLRHDVQDSAGLVNLSQDSFYRDLSPEERQNIADVNFDHPSLFAFNEILNALTLLKQGRQVQIPQYDFKSSSRLPDSIAISRADVIMFDGILAFHTKELRDVFDMKIFVDTDADTRLARRVRRDIVERGRDVLQVLDQYERTVKPSFDSYIAPTKQWADIIIPRGLENRVALDLITQHIKLRLLRRAQPCTS